MKSNGDYLKMDKIGLLLLLQLVLILLNAVFACAEIAVLSINETKLEKMADGGSKRAKRLFKLTREPAKFLATIQVAITLSGFLGSAFAADNFSEPLVKLVLELGVKLPEKTLDTIAVILITLILSYFTLVFGELVPKRLAMKKAEGVAMGISGVISFVAVAFRPIVWLLSVSTDLILRLFGINPKETEEEIGEEDIIMMVDAGSEQGSIDKEEKDFIRNVFEFDDITAREIAVHRTKTDILWYGDSAEYWEEEIIKKRHTLFPLCGESTDDIIGILNSKDFFALKERSKERVMEKAVFDAFFVPESIKADELFRVMKKTGNSMSVVIDEHGGVVGIITLEDLIEELVGELSPDNDPKDVKLYE